MTQKQMQVILIGCTIIASFTLLISLGIAHHYHESFWNNGTLASAAALALIGGSYDQKN